MKSNRKFKVDSKKYIATSENIPNAETLEALKEADDISSGKIPAKSFNSVEDLLKDLLNDVDD